MYEVTLQGLKRSSSYPVIATSEFFSMVGGNGALRSLVIGFLIANEGLSILENCGRCGLRIPKKLMDILEQLKSDNDKSE